METINVLVVDDDKEIVKAIEIYLSKEGYNILKAYNGKQALEILKENPLDIIEVYCPIDICRKRNCLREDRYEAQSEEQLELMAKNIRYSMKVDTSVYTPAECADIIVKELFV